MELLSTVLIAALCLTGMLSMLPDLDRRSAAAAVRVYSNKNQRPARRRMRVPYDD